MRRNKMIPLSFYEVQLHTNFDNYKKLAELQSKLIRNDRTNSHLTAEIQHLRAENNELRSRIQQKQVASVLINASNTKNAAIGKVNSFLDRTHTSTIQALKQKINRYNDPIFYHPPSRPPTFFHRPKEHSFPYEGHEQLRLTKNVYIDREPLKEKSISFQNSCEKMEDNNKQTRNQEERIPKNRSITEGNLKLAAKDFETSKFPSNFNDFQGKKAQSRFLECEEPRKDRQNEFNHWKSEEDFGFKSEFLGNLKSGELRKRKTYLSIVSVSSKENKKIKQN